MRSRSLSSSSAGSLRPAASLPPNSSPPLQSPQLTYRSPLSHQSPRLPYRSPQLSHRTLDYLSKAAQSDLAGRPSSPIAPTDGLDFDLLAACDEAEEVNNYRSEHEDHAIESDADQAFLDQDLDSSSDDESDFPEELNDWHVQSHSGSIAESGSERTPTRSHGTSVRRSNWIDDCHTGYAKLKLIKILNGEVLVPKQRWGIEKILATLVYHRKDRRLRTSYCQFKRFAYQTMLEESDDTQLAACRWPGVLTRKDWDSIINLRAKHEIEKRYNREVQGLCRTACFGKVNDNELKEGAVDKSPLHEIARTATRKALLISSMVFSVGPTRSSSSSSLHLLTMKLVGILVILCRSAHRNNSNYLPLLVVLYMYSAGARVDAITLLNHLGLSVSYPVLIKKLHDISAQSRQWIKQQANNRQLVGTWDNFEYQENVQSERIGDVVKFRSITMALWIKKGWRIPKKGLKQTMWDPASHLLDPQSIPTTIFGRGYQYRQNRCLRHHRFAAFTAAFPDLTFSFKAEMPIVDIINCKKEGVSIAHPFAPSMASESTIAGNISVFEDLNIDQLGLKKEDPRWAKLLTIWWGDLKTEVQMQSMKAQGTAGVGMDRAYDRYQHLFPGLALWHLRFNYLKMIWEVFYPGKSENERSTLQYAADHWHRDKTTRLTDFHSLEDLTIHSYRARIIAMLKPWIHTQSTGRRLQLNDSVALEKWLEKLTFLQWSEAVEWLEERLDQQATSESAWNDHWNNHVRFCTAMEAYLTLCYSIKWGDVGLLRIAMQEVCVILQAPAAGKPKYAKEMLRQLHILDSGAADPVLQNAYIANALVNPRGLPNTFYEMDLLLEHQNGEFKKFRADRGSSLQESDDLFRQHALSVNTLTNVKREMNRVIIGRERSGKHPTKSAAFDILSLADQLYQSKSTTLEGPAHAGTAYFSENQIPDLLLDGLQALDTQIEAFNRSLEKNAPMVEIGVDGGGEDGTNAVNETGIQMALDDAGNETVNKLFHAAQESQDLTSDLAELSI